MQFTASQRQYSQSCISDLFSLKLLLVYRQTPLETGFDFRAFTMGFETHFRNNGNILHKDGRRTIGGLKNPRRIQKRQGGLGLEGDCGRGQSPWDSVLGWSSGLLAQIKVVTWVVNNGGFNGGFRFLVGLQEGTFIGLLVLSTLYMKYMTMDCIVFYMDGNCIYYV